MLQFQEYSSTWLIYAFAAVGILVVVWRILRIIPWSFLRRAILLSIVVVIFTPALNEVGYWSPAWVVSALELLFGGVESALPALMILLKVWLVVMIIFIVVTFTCLCYTFFIGGNSTHSKRGRYLKKHSVNQRVTPISPRV